VLEASVFRALLTYSGWTTYHVLVESGLWNKSLFRDMYEFLRGMHTGTKQDFTIDEVRAYIYSVVQLEEKADEYSVLLQELEEAPELSGTALRQCVNQFASREKAVEAAKYIWTNQYEPDFDPAEAAGLIQDSLKLHSNIKVPPTENYLTSPLPDLKRDRPNLNPLRLSDRLDRAIGGGVAAGELLIFLAAAKKGKTSVLSLVGVRAALAGRKVLHVTLEVSKEMLGRRYDSALTGLNYKGLVSAPGVVAAARKRIEAAGGIVHITDWQYEEHSPSDLFQVVEDAGDVDLLIMDYLGLMIPDRTKAAARREQRHLFSKLGKDMRGVAKQLNLPVVTAWQINRMGANEDKVKEEHAAESWDIVGHADVLAGIVRSKAEIKNKKMRIHTVLSRYSEQSAMVDFHADLERNQLTEVMRHG